MASLWRLLAIVALLLTSFGMAAPGAAARYHGAGAAMAMEHCADEDGTGGKTNGVPECAMACSAALPAADLPPIGSGDIAPAPCQRSPERPLAGILLEIATPPPKAS